MDDAKNGKEAAEEHARQIEEQTSPPEPLNLADTQRYSAEQQEVKDGKRQEGPVVPYAYIAINALILFAIYYYAGKKPISEGLALIETTRSGAASARRMNGFTA